MQQQKPEYLLGLTYVEDGRTKSPNPEQKKNRLAAFKRGWAAAVKGKQYKLATLSSLKWDNYGYRMGLLEAEVDPEIQERLFEVLYDSQQLKLDKNT